VSNGNAWNVWLCGEYCGIGPDGQVKPADRSRRPHWRVAAGEALTLPAVRNGWLSLRLVVEGQGGFAVRRDWPEQTISTDLYREFHHKMADRDEWFADGLVPIPAGEGLTIPDPDNQVPGQRVQTVWVDVFVGPKARGDICWTYSGGAGIADPSSGIIQPAWRTWARDFTGNVNWHTANPGDAPWFASNGALIAMMYSGERFGVAGPMPTARLKVQRNAMQDINLLEMVARARGKDAVRADLVPGIPIELWREKAPVQRTRPPWEWGMTNLRERVEPSNRPTEPLAPLWWEPVREYARTRAMAVSRD
jgi:hypothetical protein